MREQLAGAVILVLVAVTNAQGIVSPTGCLQFCPPHGNHKPVCGSDGVTYESDCHLSNAACLNSCIRKAHDYNCLRQCGDECQMPASQVTREVCGTDGITYQSLCHLQEAACQNPCIRILHSGPCEVIQCDIFCPEIFDPVCGTDSRTYSNVCELNKAMQCQNQPCLELRATGPCNHTCGMLCPFPTDQEAVCGSDGQTYPSLCILEEDACSNPCLTLLHEGPCSGGPVTEPLPSCCIEDSVTFPNHQVEIQCRDGVLQAAPIGDCFFENRGYPIGASLDATCFPMTCEEQGWVFQGGFADCCAHCLYQGDHIFTFDGNAYDYHGYCNYSVAQVGSSFDSSAGVYTVRTPCFDGSPCYASITLKNGPNEALTIDPSNLDMVLVNGEVYPIPESGVTVVGQARSILVWRGDCGLKASGSHGISLLACPHRLDVWSTCNRVGELGGLCGHYDNNPSNDYRHRNGTTYSVSLFPLAFPASWATAEQLDPQCQHVPDLPDNGEDPCDARSMWLRVYHSTCQNHLGSPRPPTHFEASPVNPILPYVEACARDVCLMHTGGASHVQILDWLNILKALLEITLNILEAFGGSSTMEPTNPTQVTEPCTTVTTTATSTATTTTTATEVLVMQQTVTTTVTKTAPHHTPTLMPWQYPTPTPQTWGPTPSPPFPSTDSCQDFNFWCPGICINIALCDGEVINTPSMCGGGDECVCCRSLISPPLPSHL